jgi:hypothetical protein
MLSRHFTVCALTVKEVFARNLGLQKFTLRYVPHLISDPQKVTRVEASTELIQILNDFEADSFDGITTGDESWFQYLYESSAVFAKSPGDVVPKTTKGMMSRKLWLLFSLPMRSC